MARNRMIKPEFWEDPKVALLSDKAKLLFIALWNFADDEGFLENNSKWIAVKCFPYEKNIRIENFLAELFKIGVISTKNGVICIKNFLKHQKIKKATASKLKGKFEGTEKKGQIKSETDELVGKEWGTCGEPVGKEWGTSSAPFFKEKLKEVKGKEDKEKGKESVKGKPNGENPEPPFFNSPKPETANDKQQTATAEKAEIPKDYQQLVDYLVDKYGYDLDKAKLVANRVQSDKFELKPEHCECFLDLDKEGIIKCFDVMKNIYSKKSKSVFKKV